jgi:hypothetical protein
VLRFQRVDVDDLDAFIALMMGSNSATRASIYAISSSSSLICALSSLAGAAVASFAGSLGCWPNNFLRMSVTF